MNRKWLMLLLIWLMMFVAYLDRINISVAGPTIMKSLHISHSAFGAVLSAFTLGYAIMQIPGGMLGDKFGARKLLVVALVWWSIFTGVTGLATSVVFLMVTRVLFGIGEGMENGAQFKLIGDFFSSSERSAASGLFLNLHRARSCFCGAGCGVASQTRRLARPLLLVYGSRIYHGDIDLLVHPRRAQRRRCAHGHPTSEGTTRCMDGCHGTPKHLAILFCLLILQRGFLGPPGVDAVLFDGQPTYLFERARV